jgi:hypothetical protein
VETLLESARYLSANQLAVKVTGMAAWNAFKSDDGKDWSRNPVGRIMLDSDRVDAATGRPTRATAAWEVRVPTRGKSTFVTYGLAVWNACPELRNAATKAMAVRAATLLAKRLPV